jgi:hypothetical protein
MRPTQEEISALVAAFSKSSEQDRKFILATTQLCAEDNAASQPALKLVVGGAPIQERKTS